MRHVHVHVHMKKCCHKVLGDIDHARSTLDKALGTKTSGSLQGTLGKLPIETAKVRLARNNARDSQKRHHLEIKAQATCSGICAQHANEHQTKGETKEAGFWASAQHTIWDMLTTEKSTICHQLSDALSNSADLINVYEKFLQGELTWEYVHSHTVELGNASQGVTGAGKSLPKVVQDAVNEVENFEFGEEGFQIAKLFLSSLGTERSLQETHVRIEIERQKHLNEIIKKAMISRGCAQ